MIVVSAPKANDTGADRAWASEGRCAGKPPKSWKGAGSPSATGA